MEDPALLVGIPMAIIGAVGLLVAVALLPFTGKKRERGGAE